MDDRRFQPDVLQKVARKQTHHQPEYPNGQLGRQSYRRNPVGREIICHGRSDVNKDGWCVAVSFHWSPFRDLLRLIVSAPEEQSLRSWIHQQHNSWQSRHFQASVEQDLQNISLRKENFIGNHKKVAILSSINYRFIKKILFFLSSDLLPRFFFFILVGSVWVHVATIIKENVCALRGRHNNITAALSPK